MLKTPPFAFPARQMQKAVFNQAYLALYHDKHQNTSTIPLFNRLPTFPCKRVMILSVRYYHSPDNTVFALLTALQYSADTLIAPCCKRVSILPEAVRRSDGTLAASCWNAL